MITYPDDYNPLLEYYMWSKRNSKKISKKLHKQLKKLNKDITLKKSDVYYDSQKANHAIEFIENYCRNIKGKTAGKLVVLDLWEKAFIASIFGICYKDSGLRRCKRAVLIIAKKNGKSLLASAIELYMAISDGEGGAECYNVATKKDQAKIVWNVCKKMILKDKHLSKYMRITVSELECLFNDAVIKALASDSDTLDGLDVFFVAMDELQQWKNGYDLYDIMVRGMTNREQPLCLITTTAGTIRNDIYDMIYEEGSKIIEDFDKEDGFKDDESIFFIYELDSRDEVKDFENLIKANPGLGTIRNRDSLYKEWKQAIQNPSMYMKSFLTKCCNIPETSQQAYLTAEEIKNDATFNIDELKPDYVLGGVDMASTTDLTCVTFLFGRANDNNLYVYQQYFIPEDLLERKELTDKVPYKLWSEKGYVTLLEGNKIDEVAVWEWVRQWVEKHDVIISWAGFDMWGAEVLAKKWRDAFGKNSVEPVIQGYKTRSNPLKALKADLAKKRINYNNNPVLKWNLANTSVKTDNNGNIDPVKGKSRLLRIDGTISLLNAYITYLRHEESYRAML